MLGLGLGGLYVVLQIVMDKRLKKQGRRPENYLGIPSMRQPVLDD
ncbi:hypothetical protein [Dubosiella newyorkensis]